MTTRKTEQPAVGPWLDKMEETRTVNAPVLVAALRKAVRELEWYASEHSAGTRQIDNGGLALQSLTVIERMLAAGAAADDCVTREPQTGPRSSAAPGSERHWLVVVTVNNEEILQISGEHVSGVENIEDFANEVMTCAEHLAGFIGGRSGASPNDGGQVCREENRG